MIDDWGSVTAKFVKVIPFEYKQTLQLQQKEVRKNG
jgi:glutamate synthase domain-containing protein 3